MAIVEPIEEEEARQRNPRSICLLQFANGYRCSRCVVARGKLQLLNLARTYAGPQEFPYPASVRIAGRIFMFSVRTQVPEYSQLPPARYKGAADLVLPWEHRTRDRLFATKHRRFRQRLTHFAALCRLSLKETATSFKLNTLPIAAMASSFR